MPGEGLFRFFDNAGNTNLFQSFAHWKHRLNNDWTLNTGLHYTYFGLNGSNAIEPRIGLQWQMNVKEKLSASLGLHSKVEHLATYLFEGTFPDGTQHKQSKNLDLSKALHAVLGL